MATPGITTGGAAPVSPDEATVAAALTALNARLDSMAEVIDALRPLVALAQQAPAMIAIVGDSFDEVMQTAADSGIDVERGLLNGAGAALRFGATMDREKVRALESFPFDQRQERFSMYAVKAYMLPRVYWHGMLRGRI